VNRSEWRHYCGVWGTLPCTHGFRFYVVWTLLSATLHCICVPSHRSSVTRESPRPNGAWTGHAQASKVRFGQAALRRQLGIPTFRDFRNVDSHRRIQPVFFFNRSTSARSVLCVDGLHQLSITPSSSAPSPDPNRSTKSARAWRRVAVIAS
jgi:hypothetical protein